MAVGRFFKGTPQEYVNLNPYMELPFKEMLALSEMGNKKIDAANANLELYYSDILKKAAMPKSEDEKYLEAAQQKVYDIQKNVDPDKLLDPTYLQGVKSDLLGIVRDPNLDKITKSAAWWQEYKQAMERDPNRNPRLMFNPEGYNTLNSGTPTDMYEPVQDATTEVAKIGQGYGSESFVKDGIYYEGVSADKIATDVANMTSSVDFLNNNVVTRQQYDQMHGLGSYNKLPLADKQKFAQEWWSENLRRYKSPRIDIAMMNMLAKDSNSGNKDETYIPDAANAYLHKKESTLPEDIISSVLGTQKSTLSTYEGDNIQFFTYTPQKGDNVILELAGDVYPEAVNLSESEKKAADFKDGLQNWLDTGTNSKAFDLYKQHAAELNRQQFALNSYLDKLVGNRETNQKIHEKDIKPMQDAILRENAYLTNILKAYPELKQYIETGNQLGYNITTAEFKNKELNLGERKKNELETALETLKSKFQNSNRPIKFIPNSGTNKINVYNSKTGQTDVLLNGYGLMSMEEIWAALPGAEGKGFYNWSDLGVKLLEEGKIIPYTPVDKETSGTHLGNSNAEKKELYLVPMYINAKGFKEDEVLNEINRKVLTPETNAKSMDNFTKARRKQKENMNIMADEKRAFYKAGKQEALVDTWQQDWEAVKQVNAAGALYSITGDLVKFDDSEIMEIDKTFADYKAGKISKREFMTTWDNILDMKYNMYSTFYAPNVFVNSPTGKK